VATSALLVIDVSVALADAPWARAVLESIAGEIAYYRKRRRPVLYVCSTESPDDDPRQALCPQTRPDPLDAVFRKTGYSAFFGTELASTLRREGVEELRLVGWETHTGVLHTAADAASNGLAVVVPATCVAAADPADHEAALRLLSGLQERHRPQR